jgi:hypothetical protein
LAGRGGEGTAYVVAQRTGEIGVRMALLTIFGMLGLVISAAGIYGVMALGATPWNIVWMILANAGMLMAIGLAIGSMGARYLSAAVEKFLFQMEPTDARVFIAALATLTLSGLVASALPARRAASVNPVVALRRESFPASIGDRGRRSTIASGANSEWETPSCCSRCSQRSRSLQRRLRPSSLSSHETLRARGPPGPGRPSFAVR